MGGLAKERRGEGCKVGLYDVAVERRRRSSNFFCLLFMALGMLLVAFVGLRLAYNIQIIMHSVTNVGNLSW